MFHVLVQTLSEISLNWEDVIFLVGIPVLQQILKLLRDRYSITFNKWQNQLLTLVLAGLFGYLVGDFAGVPMPRWNGDLMQLLGDIVAVIGSLWAIISALYEVVYARLFKPLKIATKDTYA